MKRIYFAILFLAPAFVYAQTTNILQKKAEKIKNYIEKANKTGLFNGSLLVVDGGNVVCKAAIGYADSSQKIPLTIQYRFHIGSIAKEFDAVGIMMLKEQGKLSLDDKVSKFYPELPAWADSISIKNLLQYTSGLPEIKYRTVNGDDDNWRDLKAVKHLDFAPGSSYAYNNNNTFLRRKIIEKVSGMSIKDFIEQKMLKPCGINNGIVDPVGNEALIAQSFNNDFKQDKFIYPITGWTCLNLDDFSTWATSLEKFRLISLASTLQIITPAGPDEQSGLGSGTMKNGHLHTHVHDGIAMHYQALEGTDAAKGRTIIVLTNQRHDNVYKIKDAIEAILDGKPYAKLTNGN